MIDAAEQDGRLKPGGTVVEATAGNTGLGLALVARAKGYRVVLVVPDKMSSEKVLHLKALGAEIRMTRSDVGKGHPEYYQDMAARLAARDSGRVLRQPVRQSGQSAGARAHDRPGDLGADAGSEVDAVVCGVGSGGTLTGLSRYLRPRAAPQLEMVLADPVGSVLAPYVRNRQDRHRRLVGGRGHRRGFHPADRRSVASDARPTRSPTRKASTTARELLRQPKGSSAARRPARCSPRRCTTAASRRAPKRVVTFVSDTGTRIPLQDVQRHLDGRPGLSRAAALRRSARPGVAPLRGRRRRRGRRPTTRCSPRSSACAWPTCRSCRCLTTTGSSASSTNPTCCCTSTRHPSDSATRSRRR